MTNRGLKRIFYSFLLINFFQLIEMNPPAKIAFTEVQCKSYNTVFRDLSCGVNKEGSGVFGKGTVNRVITKSMEDQMTVYVSLWIWFKNEWKFYGFQHEVDFCQSAEFLNNNFQPIVDGFNEIYLKGTRGVHVCPYQKDDIYQLDNLVLQDLIPEKFLRLIQKGCFKINLWLYNTLSKEDVAKLRIFFESV